MDRNNRLSLAIDSSACWLCPDKQRMFWHLFYFVSCLFQHSSGQLLLCWQWELWTGVYSDHSWTLLALKPFNATSWNEMTATMRVSQSECILPDAEEQRVESSKIFSSLLYYFARLCVWNSHFPPLPSTSHVALHKQLLPFLSPKPFVSLASHSLTFKAGQPETAIWFTVMKCDSIQEFKVMLSIPLSLEESTNKDI